MKKIHFILSDHNTNSYGFAILTSGIDTSFFAKNPVMLLNHDPNDIMGKWDNIVVGGQELKALAVFDEKDPEAVKMYNKADQGMLNCVSVTVDIKEAQMDFPGFPAGVPVVTKCVLLECSLTPIPSNQNALKCLMNGEPIDNDQVVVKLSNNFNQQINIEMKKLPFFVAALSLAATATEDDVLTGVTALCQKKTDLESELTTLKTEKEALVAKLTAAEGKVKSIEDGKVDGLVDDAEKAGKLIPDAGKTIADKKEQFKSLARVDFNLAKSMIDSLPARKSLSAIIEGVKGATASVNSFEGWGIKRLHKEAPVELARIKSEEPDRFQALLKANA